VPGSELLQKKNCSCLAGEYSASIFATAFKGKLFVIRQRGQRLSKGISGKKFQNKFKKFWNIRKEKYLCSR